MDKALPPTDETRRIGSGHYRGKVDTGKPRQPGHSADHKGLCIYAGTGVIDNMGPTACVVLHDNRVIFRNLCIHGGILGSERKVYLDEVASLLALRALHDWIMGADTPQGSLRHVTMYAGDYQSVCALKRWYVRGTLALRPAAASLLVGDIRRLPG